MEATTFETLRTLGSVLIGALITGLAGYLKQRAEFRHAKEMRSLETASEDQVKLILREMLQHRSHVNRSFDALRAPIGGFDDEKIRKLLHEIGARKFSREDGEWWYLASRGEERIARARDKRARRTKSATGEA